MKKLFLTLALLCAGCPPSAPSCTHCATQEAASEPALQPTGSDYKLDTIDAYYGGVQAKVAAWITAHPNAEIISMESCYGNGFLLVIYKERP